MDDLTPNQRELLAHWFDTPAYTAFKELLELERLNTATKLVDIDPKDIVALSRHQGRAANCKELHQVLKRNYQSYIKLEKKKKKKS